VIDVLHSIVLRTTQDKHITLLQEGSLIKLKGNLPRVARDVMNLVSMLGGRFLWVDALSIVQDDAS